MSGANWARNFKNTHINQLVAGSTAALCYGGCLPSKGNRMKAAIIASLLITTPALGAPFHQFSNLALAPNGDKTATVESDDPGNLAEEPHGQVVVRDQTGKVVAHYDPCAGCRYSAPFWSPKGDALVFLGADDKAGKTMLFRAQGSAVQPLTTI